MIIRYHFETKLNAALVADINPGPADAVKNALGIAPRNYYAYPFGGLLYFQANDGQAGAELWRTTGVGAELVADIEPGPGGSEPHAFALFQDSLYFAATTSETGEGLFRYDGTAVSLAADMNLGPDSEIMGGLTVYNGSLYFTRRRSYHKVWRFDGTSASAVAAINQAGNFLIEGRVRTFTVFDGRLFYILQKGLPFNYQLWAYDGTNAQQIANLTDENDLADYNFDLGIFKGALYFSKVNQKPSETVDELWSYDGQSAPKLVGRIEGVAYPQNHHSLTNDGSQPLHFQVFKGWLYFRAVWGLFRYNGVWTDPRGQGGYPFQELTDSPAFPNYPTQLSVYAGSDNMSLLYLSGFPDSDPFGREPYFSFNGVEASMIENIKADNATPYSGSFPTIAVQAGNRLYFYAKDAEHGRELWSIRPEKVRTLIAVLVPIWEDKLKWPVAEDVRDLILATYLIAEGQTPRLVARKAIHLPTEPEPLRFLVLEIDQSRVETPDAFGLLGVVFDRRTGKKLDVGSELFGVATDSARVAIKRAAAAHGQDALFERVMSERVEDLDSVRTLAE